MSNMSNTDNIALIDVKALAELLGIGTATVWRMEAAGKLPAAVRLSQRCTRWKRAEVLAWIEAGSPPRDEWDAIKHRRPA